MTTVERAELSKESAGARAILPLRTRQIVIVLAIIAAIQLWATTPWGIGTSPDSAGYIDTARRFLQDGLVAIPRNVAVVSDNHQPPLYPLFLTLPAVMGADPLTGARWLHILLVAANTVLMGFLLHRITKTRWLVASGCLLFLSATPVSGIHSFAWSEPLFLLLGTSAIVALGAYLAHGNSRHLVAAALLTTLACLTRYAGVPLIVTGLAGILMLSSGSLRRRLDAMARFALLSTLPLLAWFARNYFIAGSATSRELIFHPVGRSHVWQVLYTTSSWLNIPSSSPDFVRIAIMAILALFAITVAARRTKIAAAASDAHREARPLAALLLLFIAFYTGFLLLSLSFFDANTPLDDRILAPLFVAGLPLALLLVNDAQRLAVGHRNLSMLIAFPLLLLVGLTVAGNISRVTTQRQTGLGYSAPAWQQSALLSEIEKLPDNIIIFSNAPEAITLLKDRDAQALPSKRDAMSQTANDSYEQEVNAMVARIEAGTAIVAYFHALSQRPVTSDAELRNQFSLEAVVQTDDGLILGAPHGAGS